MTKAQADLLRTLEAFLAGVRPSTKNPNAGFVDMRDVYDLRGKLLAVQKEQAS